jgi:hypothetical protein
MVGAGAVVTSDVPAAMTATGIPARQCTPAKKSYAQHGAYTDEEIACFNRNAQKHYAEQISGNHEDLSKFTVEDWYHD